jgi:hypothetical protein
MSRNHDQIPEIGHSEMEIKFVCSSTVVSRAPITLVLLIRNYFLIQFVNSGYGQN